MREKIPPVVQVPLPERGLYALLMFKYINVGYFFSGHLSYIEWFGRREMLNQHKEDHNQHSSDLSSPKSAAINWVDSSLSSLLSAVIDHSTLTDSDAFYGK